MPQTIRGVKICTSCKRILSTTRFYKHPLAKDGLHSQCQKCLRDKTKLDRALHPEKWRGYTRVSTLRRLYGLELADYDRMSQEQDGKCAICEAPHINRKDCNNFAIDHDHESGQIRGLLCHNCNRGLGHFKDSAELLVKAALYLRSQREAKSA